MTKRSNSGLPKFTKLATGVYELRTRFGTYLARRVDRCSGYAKRPAFLLQYPHRAYADESHPTLQRAEDAALRHAGLR